MKRAIISDIHGNLAAFTAVLKDIESQQVSEIVCLGDVIGYGAKPAECVALVERVCNIKILGNHEEMALGHVQKELLNDLALSSLQYTHDRMADYELGCIRKYARQVTQDNATYVHASPHQADQWPYLLRIRDGEIAFEAATTQLTFFGHTHLPTIFVKSSEGEVRMKTGHSFDPDDDCSYLVNVGSVGQPRDHDPRACYVIHDTDELSVFYRRVEYDISSEQHRMREAKIPTLLVERLGIGR